jgi:translocation and assembly module TamA
MQSFLRPFIRKAVYSALVILLGSVSPAAALDRLDFQVTGDSDALEKKLRAASILLNSQAQGNTETQDLFADALAEYGSLLNALYAAGYYSAVIHVLLDGREAAGIAPLDAPGRIDHVQVEIITGPAFTFSRTKIAPLARRTRLPEEFAVGKSAKSGVVVAATEAAIDGWRNQGFAKAAVSAQDVVADHDTAQLGVDVTIQSGPRLRFGAVVVTGTDRMRDNRVRKIAGLREGEVYSAQEVDRAAARLRRTGVFRSVTLAEDDAITAPDLLGMTINVAEEKPRRLSFGLEVATDTGITVTGGWLHRNLSGGGERFSITGGITDIGTGSDPDWTLGLQLQRPATFTPDTTLLLGIDVGQSREPDLTLDNFSISTTLEHYFNEKLSAELGLAYAFAKVTDPNGTFTYRSLALPFDISWDNRSSKTDPRGGVYFIGQAKPFVGFGFTDNGLRLKLDARGYKGFGTDKRFVLAGRVQIGAVLGASLLGAPRDDLFFSGGGGTVRGQPYQSLGVDVLRSDLSGTFQTGGAYLLAASLEARNQINDKLGVVGFVDIARVDSTAFFSDVGNWHSGVGLGVRYATAVGPIRLDVAAPVGGTTGSKLQIYVGLGQAF